MIEKAIIDKVFSGIRHGGVDVRYWDGSQKHYGPDKARLLIDFRSIKAGRAVLRNMTLGFGESYMDGLIEVEGDLRELGHMSAANAEAFGKLAINRITKPLQRNRPNLQKKQIQHHYDLGNDFYKLWLDESMAYSCAYFKTPEDSLEQAQQQKLDHVLRKLQLKPGMRLLDIGSGWGALLIKAARDYGAVGHGVTLSQEQYDLSRARIKQLGLEKQITIELRNYQELTEAKSFDRVVSVGMYEHVGRGNHRTYMGVVSNLLTDNGLSVLHSITNEFEDPNDPWVDKYIFPGANLPSVRGTVALFPDYNLRMIDYENLRPHYALTLDEWLRRFDAHRETVTRRYGERFYRMWRLYLAGSSSAFRYENLSLSQFVVTKGINNNLPLTRDFLYTKRKAN